VVLIKFALNNLPLYCFSIFRMPKKVESKIVRLQRRFLWSGQKDRKFYASVKWELILSKGLKKEAV